MAQLKINDILRASDIKRWTIVKTIHNQSLAEHTFNVVMIVRDICREAEIDDNRLIKLALEHDLDEIMTGDIPTPTKTMMTHIGFNPKTLEHGGKNSEFLYDYEKEILKAADLIESQWFFKNNKIGLHAETEYNLLQERTVDFIANLKLMKEEIVIVYNKVFSSDFTRTRLKS